MTSALVCSDKSFNLDEKRCCTKCVPGTGVITSCSYKNDTRCSRCVDGLSYSSVNSHTEQCLMCTKCAENAHEKITCNITHNAVCECDSGFYFDQAEAECKLCELCPPGSGASRMCSNDFNTKCHLCPNGTYSDTNSGDGCIVCTLCSASQVMLQSCSTKQNTVCLGE